VSSVKLSKDRSKVLSCEFVERCSPNLGLAISWEDCRAKQRLGQPPCPCEEVLEAARKPPRVTRGDFSFPWPGYRPHTEYEALRWAILSCANASGLMFKLADTTAGLSCHLTKFDCKEGRDVPLAETDKEETSKNTSRPFDYLLGGEPLIVGLRGLADLSAERKVEPRFLPAPYFQITPDRDGLILLYELGDRLVRYAYPNPRELTRALEEGLDRRVHECFAELTDWYFLPPKQVETAARQVITRLKQLYRKSRQEPRRLELVRSLRDILMEHFPELPPTNALHHVVFLLRAADLEQDEHWAVFDKLRKEEERSIVMEEPIPLFADIAGEALAALGKEAVKDAYRANPPRLWSPETDADFWASLKPARRGRNSPGTP
jgi:hypothetical protein